MPDVTPQVRCAIHGGKLLLCVCSGPACASKCLAFKQSSFSGDTRTSNVKQTRTTGKKPPLRRLPLCAGTEDVNAPL